MPCANNIHTISTRSVPTNATRTPVVPHGQLDQMIACPPTSSGGNATS